jgi:oligopeptide/dipeptide ABC transporter ATP-binding protein
MPVTSLPTAAARTSAELPASRETPLIEVEHLRVSFGRLRAVSDVSYQVSNGEFFGIVGESGSGKSIAARALIRLLPPSAVTAGSVFFAGANVFDADEKALRALRGAGIGFVFQDAVAALDPVYTIGAQLVEAYRASEPRTSAAAARRRAAALLAEVGIADPARCLASYPHQLSGGMKQRVVIAAALIADPQLIVADEPTTALDVTVQRQVLDLLREIAARRGLAVILITHDLAVVAEVCDRVAVFYGGIIVEEAPTASLFDTPRHPYTAALLASLPRLGERRPFKAIPGAPPKVIGDLAACPFAPRCPRVLADCTAGVPPETRAGTGHRYRCLNPQP